MSRASHDRKIGRGQLADFRALFWSVLCLFLGPVSSSEARGARWRSSAICPVSSKGLSLQSSFSAQVEPVQIVAKKPVRRVLFWPPNVGKFRTLSEENDGQASILGSSQQNQTNPDVALQMAILCA